jgi:SAM-dependent methyltransferase
MPQSRRTKPLTAKTADPRRLYELAVQEPEAELTFISRVFRRVRGRPPLRLREDFCGTALTSCEWVKARPDHSAVGLDLHRPTLAWGRRNNVAGLPEEARDRVRLLRSDVLHPPAAARGVDVIAAMNFSYWVFKTRELLGGYFRQVHRSLVRDGMFFLDTYGGYEAQQVQQERRRCKGFTYVWDQAAYNPITGEVRCHIHFEFKKGPALRRAFTYDWRLWAIPEVRELLAEAGFRRTTVYWEGSDGKGSGNGVFRPSVSGEVCAAYIAYIVAER